MQVLLAERWIIAALRHRKFHALVELNEAISELLEKLNQRPFRKREGSRASLFAELDRPVLQSLPAERYILAYWKTVRASIDYHVEIDRHSRWKACSLSRPQSSCLSSYDRIRTHAQEPPGALGMDALAVDSLG